MNEATWNDLMLPLAAIDKITEELSAQLGELRKEMNLPDDEAGAELVVIEALIAYHDAQDALAAANERYRATQHNWAQVRLKCLKEDQQKAKAEQPAPAAAGTAPQQSTESKE